MAPLPSEARTAPASPPTLTIDGVAITGLVFDGPGCLSAGVPIDTSYSQCWSIPGTNYTGDPSPPAPSRDQTLLVNSQWYVGDVAANDTNGARILIYDSSTSGAVDNMKLTGTTLTPKNPLGVAGGAQNTGRSVDIVITARFNNNTSNVNDGGNLAGAYSWGLSQGGNVDPWKSVPIPPDTKGFSWDGVSGGENVVHSGLKLTGTMVGPSGSLLSGDCSPSCSLGVLQAYADLGGPALPLNTIGYVTQSNSAATVKKSGTTTNANCDTGTVVRGGVTVHVCAPTVTYTFHYAAVGKDTLNLTDSLVGSGGPCYDDSYGGIGGWGGLIDTGYGGVARGDGYGGELFSCTDDTNFTPQINGPTAAAVARDIADGIAAGGVEACGSAGNCILTMVQATPASQIKNGVTVYVGGNQTVGFTDTGLPSAFNVITNADGIGGHLDKDLITPLTGTRRYTLVTYPPGSWQTDNISCVSTLNNGTSTTRQITTGTNSSTKIALEVLTLGVGDTLTCLWHIHNLTVKK